MAAIKDDILMMQRYMSHHNYYNKNIDPYGDTLFLDAVKRRKMMEDKKFRMMMERNGMPAYMKVAPNTRTEYHRDPVMTREDVIHRGHMSGSDLWVVVDVSGSVIGNTKLLEAFYDFMDELFFEEGPFRLFCASHDGVIEIEVEGHEDFSAIEGIGMGGGLPDFSEIYEMAEILPRGFEYDHGRPHTIIHLTDMVPEMTTGGDRMVPDTIHVMPAANEKAGHRPLHHNELVCYGLHP